MNKKELILSLKSNGFNEKILNAFNKIKRENFIPDEFKFYAYEDNAFPIGNEQTISQPYTIAFMLNILELKNKQKILEIGSGSGYVLALINEISKNSKIYGIERVHELVEKSKKILDNYRNIKVFYGNALDLVNKFDKFDRILVSASSSKMPEKLINHLNENGILVIPIKNSIFQIKKTKNKIFKKEFPGFVFVPLIEED